MNAAAGARENTRAADGKSTYRPAETAEADYLLSADDNRTVLLTFTGKLYRRPARFHIDFYRFSTDGRREANGFVRR